MTLVEGQVSTAAKRARGSENWPAVLTLCGISVVLVTAHFISYTYFAVIVAEITATSSAVVVFLTIFGLAGAAGTFLIGRFIDRSPRRAEIVTIATFTAGLGLLTLTLAPAPKLVLCVGVAVAIAVWGLTFATTGPVFQTGVMRIAAGEANRASSVCVTGVQIGIASGSALGAPLLSHSASWLPPVSALLALIMLIIVIVQRPIPAAGMSAN